MIRQGLAVSMGVVLALSAVMQMGATTPQPSGATSGLIPINDLGTGMYLGRFQGGLYPNGSNEVPADHAAAGMARAVAIQPLDPAGAPDPNGHFVLLSVGMSHTTQEFCCDSAPPQPVNAWSFMGQAAASPLVNHKSLVLVDGAAGGHDAVKWISPTAPDYDRVRDQCLVPLGLSEAQVQAVWLKQADAGPKVSLPATNADAHILSGYLGSTLRALKVRYPNLRIVFLSSRSYAGYALTGLNPEPYAYESAFAVKHVIQAQIDQMSSGHIDTEAGDLDCDNGKAPWLAWGPYFWADGLNPRGDGLIWRQTDYRSDDGTHPSPDGQQKAGAMLLDFLLNSPFSQPWFRAQPMLPGDLDGDGHVNTIDLLILAGAWGTNVAELTFNANSDLDGDGSVNVVDLLILAQRWST